MKQRPRSGRHMGGSATSRPATTCCLMLVALAGLATGTSRAEAQGAAHDPAQGQALTPITAPAAHAQTVAPAPVSASAPAQTQASAASSAPSPGAAQGKAATAPHSQGQASAGGAAAPLAGSPAQQAAAGAKAGPVMVDTANSGVKPAPDATLAAPANAGGSSAAKPEIASTTTTNMSPAAAAGPMSATAASAGVSPATNAAPSADGGTVSSAAASDGRPAGPAVSPATIMASGIAAHGVPGTIGPMPAPISVPNMNTGDNPELGEMPVVMAAAPSKPAPPAPDVGQHLGGLIDREVLGPDHGSIGRIIDVLVSAKGNVDAVVVDVGGFLGVGNRRVAIAWSLFALNATDVNGPINVKLPAQQIRSAPAYDAGAATVVVVRAPQGAPAGGAAAGAAGQGGETAAPEGGNAAVPVPGQPSEPVGSQNAVPVVAPAVTAPPPAHHQGIDQGDASSADPASGDSSLADQRDGSSDTQHPEAGSAERYAPRPNAE